MTAGDGGPRLSADPIPIGALQPISKRVSFVYFERCVIHREANAITAMNEQGTTHLPAASISTLLLGPGTRITHQAMNLLGESGVVTCWVGEGVARLYASAPALSRSTRLLQAQAQLVSKRTSRLAVARKMYQLRFPGEDVSSATMQQLRGMEGARVRRCYRETASRAGIKWNGRHYDPANWSGGDLPNRALSAANSCLYGAVHAVVGAVGCSTGLGFVHTGHLLAFVYDVADLYKAEITIPTAFAAAAEGGEQMAARVRRLVRDAMYEQRTLERAVHDIHWLLLGEHQDEEDGDTEANTSFLWDENTGTVPAGTAYSTEP